MKIIKIDHIGIAVDNASETKQILKKLFNLSIDFEEEVVDQKVNTIGFDIAGTKIELLEATDSDSPISKFIEKRGQGMHHIALEVENLDESLTYLKGQNVRLIDETPRIGAEGKRIAFLHPKSTSGILIELSESNQ